MKDLEQIRQKHNWKIYKRKSNIARNDSRLCNSWWESRQKWVIILCRLKVLLG